MNAQEARDLALDYAEGRRSNQNLMLEVEASVEHRPQTLVAVAQADAAEVVKWAAIAQMLDSHEITLRVRAEMIGAEAGRLRAS